jgi:hypothetical protein
MSAIVSVTPFGFSSGTVACWTARCSTTRRCVRSSATDCAIRPDAAADVASHDPPCRSKSRRVCARGTDRACDAVARPRVSAYPKQMPNRSTDMLHTYALLGAQARLETLQAEIAGIVRAFPELAAGRRRAANASDRASYNDSQPTRRARRKMSAAERKAVGERMKKYWAKRRKPKATQG